MKKIYFLWSLLGLLTLHMGWAQTNISGTVNDETGAPLPGATVIVEGTTRGVATDFDGNFSIQASEGDVLLITYVGYADQRVSVGSQDNYSINLALAGELEEIIVIGYGSQSKRNLTDNIASLSSEDINDIPTPSVFNTVAGKVAGVQVSQINGKVEGGLSFRIRGQSSISAGAEPLYVLDGIPLINDNESNFTALTNALLTLSQNEIQSIEILKDASSAAIYGSRGANGVVIITTKKGQAGKAKFSVNLSSGASSPSNLREWLNAEEYIELFTEAAANGLSVEGWPPEGFVEARFDRYSNNTWENRTYDTDWQKIALVDGYTHDADFQVTGGNEKTTYFFSSAYNDTKGIVRGNALDRINARLNINHQYSSHFKLGMNLSFSRTDIDRIANDNAFVTPLQAIAQAPISPSYLDGEPFSGTVYANFLLEDENAFINTIIRRVTGKVYSELKLYDDLKWNTDFAYDLYSQSEDQYRGPLAPFQSTNGEAYASNVATENYIISNYLTFAKKFNDSHDLNVIIGTELNKSKRRFSDVTGQQLTEGLQTVSSAAQITAGNGSFTGYSFVSYFARASYSYLDKYLFKASIRRDGSSRFGSEVRFGTFPAISAGWIISDENFLTNSNTINFLKLRASWGEVGNAEIGNFASRGLFGGAAYNQRPGIAPTQAGNSNLTWETSAQTDVAIEYGLFDNRLTGEIAYYTKDTDNLLFEQPLVPSSGASEINRNIGRLKNSGFEFLINSTNIIKDKFNWSTSFNLGQNINEIIELPDGNDVINRRNILREGEAVNSFYLIEYAGVDPANGDALYYLNTNNNGVLDRSITNNPNDTERVITGDPFPKWIGGLTNNFQYDNFDLSFTFQGEWGASIYNGGGRFQSANGDWFDNQSRDQLARWQSPGDITNVPQARLGAGNGTGHSTRYLQKSDFIRLRNLTLGYNFPSNLLDPIGLTNLRLYASGFNLLTFTDYDGYDPESRSDAQGANTGLDGIVFYSAPAARTISLGLNISF